MRARVALSVGGMLVFAAALNFAVVESVAPGMGLRTVVVDLAAAVAATALTIWLTARYEAGIRRIASGLAEVARGRRDLRFDVGREPLVANLAHCANECIASMADPADPSVGPLRVRKRRGEVSGPLRAVPDQVSDQGAPAPALPAPPPARATPVPPATATPVPPARATPVPPAQAAPPAAAVATPLPPAGPVPAADAPDLVTPLPPLSPAPAPVPSTAQAPTLPAPPAPQRNTPLPPAGPAVTVPEAAAVEPQVRAPSQVPIKAPAPLVADQATPMSTRSATSLDTVSARMDHYRAIFDEYRASLARLGEGDDDLTLNGFMETLTQTERSLVERHGCRAVRFSVLVEEGRVQLLPRLVR